MDETDGAARRGRAQLRCGSGRAAGRLEELGDAAGLVGGDAPNADARVTRSTATCRCGRRGPGGPARPGSRRRRPPARRAAPRRAPRARRASPAASYGSGQSGGSSPPPRARHGAPTAWRSRSAASVSQLARIGQDEVRAGRHVVRGGSGGEQGAPTSPPPRHVALLELREVGDQGLGR